ncbi:hypothetical protein P8452_61301 [Trifolium repens]|nr:hypothetical protein P8452_61301 [Trifolium repens]
MLPNPTITVFFEILQVNVYVPKDRETNQHQGYRFVDCLCVLSMLYFFLLVIICMNINLIAKCLLFLMLQAIKILNMIKLYGKPIRVKRKIGHIELTEI